MTTPPQRFQRVRLIGTGGMGEVYLADDLALGRPVAIKVLRTDAATVLGTEAVDRILREARLAARLRHPNIVTVYDIDLSDGSPKLIMEYIEGTQLAERLRDHGPLTPEIAALVMAPIADGLATAHRMGIIHRDIKPANVLLGNDGAIKLADFGIAISPADPHLTATGALIGTPAYMAPETIRSDTTSTATDVWSFGASLYAAVEGEGPFGLDSTMSYPAMILHIANDPVRPPQRAGRLTPLLQRMLAPNPDDRPGMDEVAAELRALTGGQPSAPETPAPEPPAARYVDPPTVLRSSLPPPEPAAAYTAPSYAAPTYAPSSPPSYAPPPHPLTSPPPGGPPRRRGKLFALLAVVLVVLAGGVVAFVLLRHQDHDTTSTPPATKQPPGPVQRRYSNNLSPDGRFLWTALGSQAIVVDTTTHRLVHKIALKRAAVLGRLIVSPNGDHALAVVNAVGSTGCGTTLLVIDTAQYAIVKTYTVPHYACSLSMAADDVTAVIAGSSGYVTVFDTSTGSSHSAAAPGAGGAHATRAKLAMLPDGSHFVTSFARSGAATVWDLTPKATRSVGPSTGFTDQIPSNDGTQLYVLDAAKTGSTLTCYTVATGATVWTATLTGYPQYVRTDGPYVAAVTSAQRKASGPSTMFGVRAADGKVVSSIAFSQAVSSLRNDSADQSTATAITWLASSQTSATSIASVDLATKKQTPIAGSGRPIALSNDGKSLFQLSTVSVVISDVATGRTTATIPLG